MMSHLSQQPSKQGRCLLHFSADTSEGNEMGFSLRICPWISQRSFSLYNLIKFHDSEISPFSDECSQKDFISHKIF